MSILGLVTRKENQRLINEAIKLQLEKIPQWLRYTAAADNEPDPTKYGYQADTYRKLSWVLAAVTQVASEVALAEGEVKRINKAEDPEAIDSHPFEKLLQRPNPLDSHYEFMYATAAMKKLTGNAYWWLNKASEKAKPDEMWVIPSHMIRPIPDEKMFIRGYMYDYGDGEMLMQPWEIVHFRNFNPFSRFVGLSAIESLAMNIQSSYGMEKYIKNFYVEGGGRSPSILTFADMIGNDQWETIQKETRAASKDKTLLMMRGVGTGSVNLLKDSVTQKDQELISVMDANREEIFTVLAPGLSSMLDVSATEANAVSGRATFKERAVYPELVAIAEKITNNSLPVYGDNLFYEFDDIRWADRNMELAEMKAYAETHTIEEIRAEYYNDKKLGDERDKLFVIQITPPQSAKPKEEKPIEKPVIDEVAVTEQPDTQGAELDVENIKAIEPAQIKALVELDRWQDKSVKAGKLVTWHCVDLPLDVHKAVNDGMSWEDAREMVKGTPVESEIIEDIHPIPPGTVVLSRSEMEDGKTTLLLEEAIKALQENKE